jgi:2,3-dihydroxybenzoate decarboxylase
MNVPHQDTNRTMTRRQAIGGTATLLASLAAASTLKAQGNPAEREETKTNRTVDPHTEFSGEYTRPRKPVKKIALEEHFCIPSMLYLAKDMEKSIAAGPMEYYKKRLLDFDNLRIEEMDKYGIDLSVLSMTVPGVQLEPDVKKAVDLAKVANDTLATAVQRHPSRLAGFAHLPLQAPNVAADELERAVKHLGFKGALVNGSTNGEYYDAEKFYPVWERAEALGVPIYLHPANALEVTGSMAGYPELWGAMWGWTPETATHILRLIVGGVFDRFPKATVITGHMGETLPAMLWRLDSRFQIMKHTRAIAKMPSDYIRENLTITTSGVFSFPPLQCAMLALGVDRIMFSVDYPYESTKEGTEFIEAAPISEPDREMICHGNAERILKLSV